MTLNTQIRERLQKRKIKKTFTTELATRGLIAKVYDIVAVAKYKNLNVQNEIDQLFNLYTEEK